LVAALLPCVLCGEKSGTSMPWNFQIFRGNASVENVGAVPKAQLLLSSELSQTPVFIGFSDTMSGVQKFHGVEKIFHGVDNFFHANVGIMECRDINPEHPFQVLGCFICDNLRHLR
jgi:hypothetical protein